MSDLLQPEVELLPLKAGQRDVLLAARALIEDPEHWTTGTFARDSQGGDPVEPYSPKATCFCAAGAALRAMSDLYPELRLTERELLASRLWTPLDRASRRRFGIGSISVANDRFDHAAVLLLFDDALSAEDDDVN